MEDIKKKERQMLDVKFMDKTKNVRYEAKKWKPNKTTVSDDLIQVKKGKTLLTYCRMKTR